MFYLFVFLQNHLVGYNNIIKMMIQNTKLIIYIKIQVSIRLTDILLIYRFIEFYIIIFKDFVIILT